MRTGLLTLASQLRPQAEVDDDVPVRFTYSRPEHGAAQRTVIRTIERLTGQPRLRRLYEEYRHGARTEALFEAAIRLMRIEVSCDRAVLDRVPRQGPVVFVANHPFGVLDGVGLAWLATQVRPDTKLLTHSLLCQPPEARDHLLPIDFGGTPEAIATTLRSRATACRWLADGHAIAIFPGGSVATSQTPFHGPAIDPPWHPFAAKLIRGSRATVVPIYFHGSNSRVFQLASHVNYALRLSLLFHETTRRIGTRLEAAIGEPLPYETLMQTNDRRAFMLDLRRRTLALSRRFHRNSRDMPDYRREFHFPKYLQVN